MERKIELCGPFSWEQLKLSISDSNEEATDITTQETFEEHWIKFIPSEKAPAMMTPHSKSGTASRLEEIWEPSFETPSTPSAPLSNKADNIQVPKSPIRKGSSSEPLLVECSQQDLFVNPESSNTPKSPATYFSGIIGDEDLANISLTPLAFQTNQFHESEAEEDLFDEIDDSFLDAGLTQLYTSKLPTHDQLDTPIPSVGFVTGRNKPIKPPSEDKLKEAAAKLENWASSSPAYSRKKKSIDLNTCDIVRGRPSDVFSSIQLNAASPTTPLDGFGAANARSSLGLSVLGRDDIVTQTSMKEPTTGGETFGFKFASGKKIVEPSPDSLIKAQKLLSEDCDDLMEPSGPSIIGFSTAGGKKLKPPSDESLKKAQALIDDAMHDNTSAHSTKENLIERKSSSNAVLPKLPKASDTFSGILEKHPVKPHLYNGQNKRFITPVTKRSLLPTPLSNLCRKSAKVSHVFDLTVPLGRIQLRHLRRREKEYKCLLNDILYLHRNLIEPTSFDNVDDELFAELKERGAELISREWLENHSMLIILKIGSIAAHFDAEHIYCFENVRSHLINQLLYRYEIEFIRAKRSPLRLLCEGDGVKTGLYTLFIRDIRSQGQVIELNLSDGWYSLWAIGDRLISNLTERQKLIIGQKIQVCNLERIGTDAVAILDAEKSGIKLRLCCNAIRPCKWSERLGHRPISTYCRPLSLIDAEGGEVPCIEVIILKRFTETFVLSFEDGTVSEKSKREWEHLQDINEKFSAPISVTMSLKLLVYDMRRPDFIVPIKLLSSPEEMLSSCVPGRKLRILKARPFKCTNYQYELKVYQCTKQVEVLELTNGFGQLFDSSTLFEPGKGFDIKLHVVRFETTERYLWAITDKNELCSLEIWSYRDIIPKLKVGEEIFFKDLRFLRHDEKLGIEVFELTIHTDWERRRQSIMDMNNATLKSAVEYVDKLVRGPST